MTKLIGTRALTKEELKADKKKCIKVGPCGIGEKALYLNSFYIDRRYYVRYEDISRVFKRVAMSKGGFSGKGVFGSMAYLIVKLKDGTEKQCNFKYENNVDLLLEEIERRHTSIPTHSEEAEKKLRKAREEEMKLYKKNLSSTAKKTIEELKEAKKELEVKPEVYEMLAAKAKQKRVIEGINPTYKVVALVIFLLAAGSAAFGLYALSTHQGYAVYFLLFGIAFIFFISATRVLPTGKNNKKNAAREWDEALNASRRYLEELGDFPLPAQYAHPVVLERMIRVIRMGRAENAKDAFEIVKKDLKALNKDVTVSQREYDEVVVVKPLFLVMNYE